MPVLLVFIVLAVIAALVVIPAVAVAASRAAVRGTQGRIPVEDAATQDRLERIEEAIDAMAAQIERLTQQQQLLLAARGPDAPAAPPPSTPNETTE